MGRAIEEMKYMQTNTYCLHISRDELEALYFKASCVNVTIEQLLKDIIADLVGGTFTHGSDERMYADQWFRRCYMFPDKTFIRYLIIRDKVDELLEDYEKLKEYQNDYVQMQKSPDVYELDSIIPSRFTSLMVSVTGMPTTQALHLHTALYARSMISPVTKGRAPSVINT